MNPHFCRYRDLVCILVLKEVTVKMLAVPIDGQ